MTTGDMALAGFLKRKIAENGGNVSRTAKVLDVDRTTLYELLHGTSGRVKVQTLRRFVSEHGMTEREIFELIYEEKI